MRTQKTTEKRYQNKCVESKTRGAGKICSVDVKVFSRMLVKSKKINKHYKSSITKYASRQNLHHTQQLFTTASVLRRVKVADHKLHEVVFWEQAVKGRCTGLSK